MSYRPVTAWLFGKLPAHGDFISRGVEPAMRDRLDLWLSDEMKSARDRHGEAFEGLYDSVPAARFAYRLPGSAWEGGALCASVDASGRRFPLIVGRSAPDAAGARAMAGHCEEQVFAAFAGGWDADGLASSLGAGDAGVPGDDHADQWWVEGEDDRVPLGVAGPCPPGLFVRLLGVVT